MRDQLAGVAGRSVIGSDELGLDLHERRRDGGRHPLDAEAQGLQVGGRRRCGIPRAARVRGRGHAREQTSGEERTDGQVIVVS